MMLIQGIEVNTGDTVTFKTKHQYDKSSRTGKFVGIVHFNLAKSMFDIVAYHKNLIHASITLDIPYTNCDYVVIQDENSKYFASTEAWMQESSFKKISESFIDVRIYNVADETVANTVIQKLRDIGHPAKKM